MKEYDTREEFYQKRISALEYDYNKLFSKLDRIGNMIKESNELSENKDLTKMLQEIITLSKGIRMKSGEMERVSLFTKEQRITLEKIISSNDMLHYLSQE